MTGALPRAFVAISLFAGPSLRAAPDVADFEALIKSGQYEQASQALPGFIHAHPDSWQALYQLGYVEFRLHHFQPSVKALARSLELNTNFPEAHKILALDLNILGRKDLAIRELERAVHLAPASAESFYELGRIYYDEGSYVKAVSNLERSRALDPAFTRVHNNLGLAYYAVGEKEKAVSEFETGVRLNSRQSHPSAWPLIDYASFCNGEGQPAKARDLLLASIRIEDKWDRAYDELSKAYRALGQQRDALESLRRAVALNPAKPEYHYALARLYSQLQQPADARRELAEYAKVRGTAAVERPRQ